MSRGRQPVALTQKTARAIWLHAQRLDADEPFGSGPDAVKAAVEHLGYVQIDTINVIERCHHHILFNRIPQYRRGDLATAQSDDRSVFEYWTHALSYVPVRDLPIFLPDMAAHRDNPSQWYADAGPDDLRKLLRRIRRDGAISIRDIDDDEPVEKDHPWASRKPSKRVLQLGFYNGELAISRRDGMVKTYELMERHFGWPPRPRPATTGQRHLYLLERAIRTHGVIDTRVRTKKLVPVIIGEDPTPHWAPPVLLEQPIEIDPTRVHILSPFDPLIIQRRRTAAIFGYDHVFEAYLTKAKRRFGYFTTPVLMGDEIVAVLDLKTDRAAGRMLIQAWHWVGAGGEHHRPAIEAALDRFTAFQLGQ